MAMEMLGIAILIIIVAFAVVGALWVAFDLGNSDYDDPFGGSCTGLEFCDSTTAAIAAGACS